MSRSIVQALHMAGLTVLMIHYVVSMARLFDPSYPDALSNVRLMSLVTFPLILLLLGSRLWFVFRNGFHIAMETPLQKIVVILALCLLVPSALVSPLILLMDSESLRVGTIGMTAYFVVRGLWFGAGFLELVAANSRHRTTGSLSPDGGASGVLFGLFLIVFGAITGIVWLLSNIKHI